MVKVESLIKLPYLTIIYKKCHNRYERGENTDKIDKVGIITISGGDMG